MPAVIAHGSNGIKWISFIIENSARWDLIQMEGGNGVIIYTIQQTMGSNLDDFAMRQTITRTIATTPLVQNANIWEKKNLHLIAMKHPPLPQLSVLKTWECMKA